MLNPSTVQAVHFNVAAIIVARELHYQRLERHGLPYEPWDTASLIWKQTVIEHAAHALEYALENLKPIVDRPKLAMVKAPAPFPSVGSETRVDPSGGDSDHEPIACPYCGCAMDPSDSYCSPLCAVAAETEQ